MRIRAMLMDCGHLLAIGGWTWKGKRRVIVVPLPWQFPIPYKLKLFLRRWK